MKYIYATFFLLFLGFLFSFGLDREVARNKYIDLLNSGGFENKVDGCLYRANCKYYTKLLHNS